MEEQLSDPQAIAGNRINVLTGPCGAARARHHPRQLVRQEVTAGAADGAPGLGCDSRREKPDAVRDQVARHPVARPGGDYRRAAPDQRHIFYNLNCQYKSEKIKLISLILNYCS